MISTALLNTRANLVIERTGKLMPYELMVRKLQQQLAREKNKEKREQLEVTLTILLAQVTIMKQLEQFVQFIAGGDRE